MGVKCLTSYMHQNADDCFSKCHLKDSLLVIDGYALAASLYSHTYKKNSAFGGDYDKYAKEVTKFFNLLKCCNLIPIVVCDGGYEKRKVNTVKKRTLNKIFTLERLSPCSAHTLCFPLMIRHVFREVLLSKNVSIVQSDFEADSEIAALARKLDVPVLSNDSDFFIFDVKYIPLSTIQYSSFEKDKEGKKYIPCEMFLVENLLKKFGGLSKTMLPLLASLLGNDYIKARQFRNFWNLIKKDQSKKTMPGGDRVKGLIRWLQNESFESALDKILCTLEKGVRKAVRRNILNVVKGYTNLDTPLESYLPTHIQNMYCTSDSVCRIADELSKIVCIHDESHIERESEAYNINLSTQNEESESDVDSDTDGEGGDIFDDTDEVEFTDSLPPWLLDESRKVNLCPAINTLISLRLYFFDPQVENYSLPHAGNVSIPILQTIIGYLGIDSITYWSRVSQKQYRGTILESLPVEKDLTKVLLKNQFNASERKEILLQTLKIDDWAHIEGFPEEWQLYFMSIIYWIKSVNDFKVMPYHLHAVIITSIVVGVINAKIRCWQKKKFTKIFGRRLKVLSNKSFKKYFSNDDPIEKILNTVSTDECILAMDMLIQYFQTNSDLQRCSVSFSRDTMHLYSQLQHSFDFAVMLNSLLLNPFKRSNLSMFYNGTFLYNFTITLKGRPNVLSYIETLFSNNPVVIYLHRAIYMKLCDLTIEIPKQKLRVKKKSRLRKVGKPMIVTVDSKGNSEEEQSFEDLNNKYSVLNRLLD